MLLTAFLALLVSTAPAAAAQSCGRKVIDDWWDGRIDGTYELHCYDDAIEILPRDVRDYSSAEDDIKRALQAALRGEPAPPNSAAQPGDEEPTKTTTTGTPGEPPTSDPPAGPDGREVAPPLGESASSVPLPLLILAGLALALVLAGSAGYLIRRYQSRQIPPPTP